MTRVEWLGEYEGDVVENFKHGEFLVGFVCGFVSAFSLI
jgi:hypothetical protein